MKKTCQRGHSTMNELNITPLLDLVFVLLVIFIITTPQMINSLEMTLPSGQTAAARSQQAQAQDQPIVVDDKGRVFLNNDSLPDTDSWTNSRA